MSQDVLEIESEKSDEDIFDQHKFYLSTLNNSRFRTLLMLIITAVLLLTVLYQARGIFIPITLAWLLSLTLSPIILFCRKHHIPNPVSATAVLISLMLLLSGVVMMISEPATKWITELPSSLSSMQSKLNDIKGSMTGIKDIGEKINDITVIDEEATISVKVDEATWIETLLTDDIPAMLSSGIIILVLTFFLLSSQGHLLRQVTKMGSRWSQKKQIVLTAHRIRTDLSIYLALIVVINAFLGLVVALAMQLLGMNNPVFWGLVAATLNFAPYVGAIATTLLLTLAALTEFSAFADIISVPLVFICITLLEGQFVTPLIVGRRLSLSPVAVFISVVFWTWMWGAAGALMAAPLLACTKLLCENLRPLRPLNYLIEK